jgi:hypothetical protein
MRKVGITIIIFCSLAIVVFGQKEKDQKELQIKPLDVNQLTSFVYGTELENTKVVIDENNNLVFTKIIDSLQLSKDEIYNRAWSFFVYHYMDAKSVIQQQDKQAGIIIGKGIFNEFHVYTKTNAIGMGIGLKTFDTYSAYHILRIDIKEGRIRIILSIDSYEINRKNLAYSTGLLPVSPSQNETNIKKAIGECSPIDTITMAGCLNKGQVQLGKKKMNSYEKKMISVACDEIESQYSAFMPLCKRAKNTIEALEKAIKEGNVAKETEKW